VDAMEDAIDTRIAGKTASSAMPLFSNTTPKWTSTTFVPNSSFWLDDIRDKFTGIHMYAGSWTQSYGLMPVSSRHCISCGHNGPRVGDAVRYVNVDGTVFETTILKWINDYPGMPSSDTKGTSVADLSVYLLEHSLPSWVAKVPIFPSLTPGQKRMLTDLEAPLVCISQGNRDEPEFSGDQLTPNNRKAYIVKTAFLMPPSSGARAPFTHSVTTGDSGTPMYIVVGDEVYLYQVISGDVVADRIPYINSLIARADTAAGISTGYTVAAVPWPLP